LLGPLEEAARKLFSNESAWLLEYRKSFDICVKTFNSADFLFPLLFTLIPELFKLPFLSNEAYSKYPLFALIIVYPSGV